MKKTKFGDVEIELEDRDWALIEVLKDLTTQLRRIANGR